jgi:hypothetical protein
MCRRFWRPMWRRELGDAMSDQVAARSADVLLRAMGGRTVMLRMPAPAVPADVGEQLGIAAPVFHDYSLAPALSRKSQAKVAAGQAATFELLVSALAVEKLVGSLDHASASVLFANAYGVLANDQLHAIVSATQEPPVGEAHLYRLLLRSPLGRGL